MGTSWMKRHAHEVNSATRIANEKARYDKWKAQFCTMNGNTPKWDDRKVRAWMKARSEHIDIGGEEE